ncbi:MAG: hypothetical protein ICCCNLDF_03677 [Planctomycetes bacterium]|nr:hypothetical protein [Planctomycetota bacterium]
MSTQSDNDPSVLGAETAYLFRHAALLEAARDLFDPQERGRLHAHVVELLESNCAPGGRESIALELYTHARRAEFHGYGPDEVLQRRQAYLQSALEAADRSAQWLVAYELSQDALEYDTGDADRIRRLLRLSGYALKIGRTDSAIHAAEEASGIALRIADSRAAGEARLREADAMLLLSRFDAAAKALDGACQHFEQSGSAALRADMHALRGQVYFHTGALDRALDEYDLASRHYRSAGDLRGVARVIGDRANIFQRVGDFGAAESCLNDVSDLAELLNDGALRARTLLNESSIYMHRRDLDTSLDRLRRAAALFQQLGEYRGLAKCVANESILLSLAGQNDAALVKLSESSRIAGEMGEASQLASNLHQAGIIHMGSGRFVESHEAFESCATLAGDLGLTPLKASAVRHCGSARWCLNDVVGARHYFRLAAELQRATGQLAELALTLVQIASLSMIEGEVFSAQPCAEEALDLLVSLGDSRSAAYWRVLVMLIRCEHARGNMKKALFIAGEARSLAGTLGKQITSQQALSESLEYIESLFTSNPIAPIDEGVLLRLEPGEESQAD